MFKGEFRYSLDAKGRLTIPSKIRNQCQETVVVSHGNDGSLSLYTPEAWEPHCQKLLALPTTKQKVRDAIRLVIASGEDCDLDKLGRIVIPATLRKKAGIVKECVILGVGDHCEIWSAQRWDEYYANIEENYDDILESLDL